MEIEFRDPCRDRGSARSQNQVTGRLPWKLNIPLVATIRTDSLACNVLMGKAPSEVKYDMIGACRDKLLYRKGAETFFFLFLLTMTSVRSPRVVSYIAPSQPSDWHSMAHDTSPFLSIHDIEPFCPPLPCHAHLSPGHTLAQQPRHASEGPGKTPLSSTQYSVLLSPMDPSTGIFMIYTARATPRTLSHGLSNGETFLSFICEPTFAALLATWS